MPSQQNKTQRLEPQPRNRGLAIQEGFLLGGDLQNSVKDFLLQGGQIWQDLVKTPVSVTFTLSRRFGRVGICGDRVDFLGGVGEIGDLAARFRGWFPLKLEETRMNDDVRTVFLGVLYGLLCDSGCGCGRWDVGVGGRV
jgi:hypothetical protein